MYASNWLTTESNRFIDNYYIIKIYPNMTFEDGTLVNVYDTEDEIPSYTFPFENDEESDENDWEVMNANETYMADNETMPAVNDTDSDESWIIEPIPYPEEQHHHHHQRHHHKKHYGMKNPMIEVQKYLDNTDAEQAKYKINQIISGLMFMSFIWAVACFCFFQGIYMWFIGQT